MIINPDILRRDLVQLMRQIDAQIADIEERAKQLGVASEKMRDANNSYIMAPLLLAKVQAYATLVQLQSR
jgi:hypothetical protein